MTPTQNFNRIADYDALAHAVDRLKMALEKLAMAIDERAKTSRRVRPRISKENTKDGTAGWFREVFEIPDAVLLPGTTSTGSCPIANMLVTAGLKEVRVLKTRLHYQGSNGGPRTLIFPAVVRRFVSWFDAGYFEELKQAFPSGSNPTIDPA